MHTKRRPNNGMSNNSGGQNRHHNNNRPRRFSNNGGSHSSGNDSGNVARTRRNAQQNKEKYQNMARDAMSMGDRVLAENYLQHADHYHRVILSLPPEEAPRQHQPRTNADGGNHNQDGHQDGQQNDQPHDQADASGDQEHNEQQMPSADALPSFITQQPVVHPPQNFEE